MDEEDNGASEKDKPESKGKKQDGKDELCHRALCHDRAAGVRAGRLRGSG